VAGWFISSLIPVFGQQPSSDTGKIVEILPGAHKLEFRKVNDTTDLQIISGNVRLRQGTTIFTCDSCVINNSSHVLEAFGKVHINDSDTANIYSDYLRYLIDKRIAYFKKNVRLTDGKGTLTTNDLQYDMNTKLGIYSNGGRVLMNKGSILTSTEGYYYADTKDIYFKKNVHLVDPSYSLTTDSLLYNTQTEVARFITETYIRDSSGRTIVTREGYYDTKNKKAEFGRRPVIREKNSMYIGDRIITTDSISRIIGNAVVKDTSQGTTIIAGEIMTNHNSGSFLAFNKPLMIVKQDRDSIYITADTLFSAKLSELRAGRDSLKKEKIKGVKVIDAKDNKDSTDRYFEAFNHVKIFSDSVQAVCDSMFYSFKDSVFRLYQHPVVWSKDNQISGDTIYLFTKNKKADRLKVFENSFLASHLKAEIFNQIKSSRMDGWLTGGSLDSIRARGYAECIFYIQDQDSAFTGINQSSSDIIDIYFGKQELQKVVFRSAVKGTIWPMHSKKPSDMRLKNFKWLEGRRPKTKFDLFE
jgi:lipopolysaccharide export system protein LptA